MNSNIIKKAAALGLAMGMIMSFAACTAKTEHKENTETSETLRAKVEAGDEATARWEEINANAAPDGIELLGSDWIRIDI